jgi:hypothetical protein
MGWQEVIDERVSFPKEQISPKNKALVNQAFQVRPKTSGNAEDEKI